MKKLQRRKKEDVVELHNHHEDNSTSAPLVLIIKHSFRREFSWYLGGGPFSRMQSKISRSNYGSSSVVGSMSVHVREFEILKNAQLKPSSNCTFQLTEALFFLWEVSSNSTYTNCSVLFNFCDCFTICNCNSQETFK